MTKFETGINMQHNELKNTPKCLIIFATSGVC